MASFFAGNEYCFRLKAMEDFVGVVRESYKYGDPRAFNFSLVALSDTSGVRVL